MYIWQTLKQVVIKMVHICISSQVFITLNKRVSADLNSLVSFHLFPMEHFSKHKERF